MKTFPDPFSQITLGKPIPEHMRRDNLENDFSKRYLNKFHKTLLETITST